MAPSLEQVFLLLAPRYHTSLFPSHCVCHSASVTSLALPPHPDLSMVVSQGPILGPIYLSVYTVSPRDDLTKSHSLDSCASRVPKARSPTHFYPLIPDLGVHRPLKLPLMKRRALDFLPNLLFLHLSGQHTYLSSDSVQIFSHFPSPPCLIQK